MRIKRVVIFFLFLLSFLSPFLTMCWADTYSVSPNDELVVATKVAPPFSMLSESGDWYGISIDLWKLVAQRMGTKYRFQEYDLHGLLSAVEKHEVDLGVAAISVTSEREKVMDFSHSYYQTGLGLAIRDIHDHSFKHVLKKLTGKKFLILALTLLTIATCLAYIFWVLEKRTDNKYFTQGPGKGLGTAILWAIKLVVSGSISVFDMKRFPSRVLALILSFFGMTFIASYTAIITSTLTVNELQSTINSPADLPRFRVVVIDESSAEEYLEYYHVKFKKVASVEEGLEMIRANTADVMVHDKPVLTFALRSDGARGLRILPKAFGIEEYGIALPDESPLEEEIDQLILEIIEEAEYQAILQRYLSEPK